MTQVFVSIGSNIERDFHIAQALDALTEHFGRLRLSSVYESEAVGFAGDNFYNLVAEFATDLDIARLSQTLKQIEDDNGRCRQGPRFSGRTLDIDILTYADSVGVVQGIELPRDEILKNAFVLQPLAELAPDALHPELKQAYAALWADYDKAKQLLWPVTYIWHDQPLPCL
ncbi:2-amino-4-hydroxy-6-hydroxymethyldihydropteridine diphosphokinase [Pontibacter sp. JAM-7]|uniref:2-amino-4-hydroxy-6- hydroxymethyldihydropteridine diphosphokinase n=1 Tax=Pontibacter sp. JAM-7 TaxID=3366581 RepID=UPI003AF96338